jgi:hypothetical protein
MRPEKNYSAHEQDGGLAQKPLYTGGDGGIQNFF